MFEVFPVLGWLTLGLALVVAVATRTSEGARETRVAAGISLFWLLPPALLSWLLLAVYDGDLWKTHVVLFLVELVLVVRILARYRSWIVLPLLFGGVCLVWAGGIAIHESGGEHPIQIGEELPIPRGSTQASVSKSFKKAELERVLDRARQFAPSGALNEFTCGDYPPPLRVGVELIPEGEYQERRVVLSYHPDLSKRNDSRCVERGIDYLFDAAVREVDSGPPINYGYVNPQTRASLYDGEWIRYSKPLCRCDLRSSGREWVAYSEKAAAALR